MILGPLVSINETHLFSTTIVGRVKVFRTEVLRERVPPVETREVKGSDSWLRFREY